LRVPSSYNADEVGGDVVVSEGLGSTNSKAVDHVIFWVFDIDREEKLADFGC